MDLHEVSHGKRQEGPIREEASDSGLQDYRVIISIQVAHEVALPLNGDRGVVGKGWGEDKE